MTINSDGSLLNLIANNNRVNSTKLYRRYREELFIFDVKVIRSKEDSADIIQRVFLSLWNRRKDTLFVGSVGAYHHTSVKYKAIHFIEKNYTRRNYITLIEKLNEISTSASPETNMYTRQMEKVLQVVIEKMFAKLREVYRLSRNKYLSHKKIATRLSFYEETVK